eukprot:Selendium_serpulae@DN6250_c0_g1_i4.p1
MSLANSMKNQPRRGSAGEKQQQRMLETSNHFHDVRVRNARSTIDNAPPKVYPHIKNNLKREQMLRERYQSIDQDNRRLLRRIAEIHLGPKYGREFEAQLLKAQEERKIRQRRLANSDTSPKVYGSAEDSDDDDDEALLEDEDEVSEDEHELERGDNVDECPSPV